MTPYTLVILMLLKSFALMVAPPVEAASGRGGTNDDYTVKTISLGNSSKMASQWIQSDGTVMDYIFVDTAIEIKVTVQRFGTGAIGETAPVMLEVIHPIGFIMETYTWNTGPLTGGQQDVYSMSWTPTAAHSILNTTTNDLTGGLILRATVAFGDDSRNENDVKDETVPIAITSDIFDGTTTGDSTFFSGKYPSAGGGAVAAGSWVTDSGASAAGASHWRHSSAGSNYPSNAEATRLINCHLMAGQTCGVDSVLDGEISNIYGQYLCRSLFYSNEYVSSQYHIQAWGSMSTGDSVSLELWRGSGNINDDYESVSWDISQGNQSAAPGQWTNISWDPQETWIQIPNLANPDIFLGGNSYSFGLLFNSDSSSASEGFHVDDMIQFGVSKVSDYTVDLQCDNPSSGGYTIAPNQMAILQCSLTNNGYSPATIRVETNVTNDSWMVPFPIIRMDIEGSSSHGTNVIMPVLGAGDTIEFWANLTVPAGADVQQQTWNLWLSDASSAQLGEKARLEMDLAVSEQFGVALTSTVGLLAATFGPGEYGTVDFRLQNTGNKDAAFNLVTSFSDTSTPGGWSATVLNDTGVIRPNPITLAKGERIDLTLNITAPELAPPGPVSFNLRATCPSCSTPLFGTDQLVRNIEVPVLRDVQLETEEYSLTGSANGNGRSVIVNIFNLGNDDEQYDLSIVQSNWRLQASLPATQSPVLDAWDGEGAFVLRLAMPVGLTPALYTVKVIATNVADPSVSTSIDITVDILETAAVFVSDEDTGQSYIPGDPAQTMAFEVRNDGNSADRFDMTLDIPVGMQAKFTNLVNGQTTEIDIGSSFNVTVEFSFLAGAEGDLTLGVIATSASDDTVSATGEATYLVGSQNWLKIYTIQPVSINEEGEYEVTVRVKNQYTTAQVVVIELDDSETKSWFQTKIDRLDRDFSLGLNEEREVTLTLEVTETTLKNLNSEVFVSNLTIWARSETVSDAANGRLEVTLIKQDSDSEDVTDGAGSGFQIEEIALWGVFLLILVGGVIVLLTIMRSEEEDDDEYKNWGEDGYEDSLSANYGAVASAPTVPVAGAPSPEPIPAGAPPTAPAKAPQPASAPVDDGMPPLPAGGLPNGWTMEQWKHYGQQWLEQNGQA